MPHYEYSIKAVNPLCMSQYKTIKVSENPPAFTSVDKLREFMAQHIPASCDISSVEIGYIEPGHSSKGKKVWLLNDLDLKAMYNAYKGRKLINLWGYTEQVYTKGKKRSRSPCGDSNQKGGNYESHCTKKMAAVNETFEELKSKHKGKYSPEQLRAWAHLVEMGKCDSIEQPPDKPFFRGRKSTSTPEPTAVVGVSPGKKVNMRSQLIEQLQKWYQLLDTGAITQVQYDERKETIMKDIKEL